MLGNLPLQLTSFVGRETELSQVRGRLTQHRLVTLTGPGGVGKTRLALEVAASAQHTFADGVWLAELASLADPEMLPGVVAAALGLRDDGARSPVHVLAEHLRSAELLLVLDNCEHLLQACADLAEHLLRSCPRLRILATSREALRVPGEIAWLVPSLRPETDGSRLFVERASAVLPRGLAADSNAAAAEICRRLDGIPLAIELAATRLAAFTPEQLAGRLDDRFRLLTGGPRSALPRHQTLRALVDWSHDLLSQDEQRLFRRLSVFGGGWTMEAAEAVCSGDGLPRNAVPALLADLVQKSLVSARLQEPGGRYRFLETLRQYAAEKLDGAGEAAAVRDKHLEHFVALAEPGYGDSPRERLLLLLGPELDNVRGTRLGAGQRQHPYGAAPGCRPGHPLECGRQSQRGPRLAAHAARPLAGESERPCRQGCQGASTWGVGLSGDGHWPAGGSERPT